MFRQHLKLAIRGLGKQKLYALINIAGLSTGIASFILIAFFVYYEWNYDEFHPDKDRIYQVCRLSINPDGSSEAAGSTPMPLTSTLRSEYDHMGTTIGIYDIITEETAVTVNGEEHFGFRGVSVDLEFFQVFNFPLEAGNPKKCLDGPKDVVISQRAAGKLFGATEPLGNIFQIRDHEFIVRGIAKNPPNNTVFKYDVFFSPHLRPEFYTQLEDGWWSSGPYNFIKLKEGITPDAFEFVFNEVRNKHFPDWLKDRTGFNLQPLNRVHLNTEVAQQIYPAIDEKYLVVLTMIGISLILLACINYVNLATSLSGQRAKETGIKKAAGASRGQLMAQFFSESITLCILAVVVSLILVELFLPWFNLLANRNLDLKLYSFPFLSAALGFGILTGLMAGFYPALVLSSFKPVTALKPGTMADSKMTRINGRSRLRKSLVIFQLTITLILISTEVLILKQIHYMENAALGYNLADIISIPLWSAGDNQEKRFELAKRYLEQVEPYRIQFHFSRGTISENIPGFFIQNQFRVTNPDTHQEIEIISIAIDERFMDVFEIGLVDGKGFDDPETRTEPEKILVNQAVLKEMRWDHAIGKSFELWPGYNITIIGIIHDLHVESLQHKVGPQMFRFGPQNNFPQFVSFRLNPEEMNEAILLLQGEWKKLIPDSPFMYYFPKDKYLEHYNEERRVAKILATFVTLTILISGLGIFGLVLFNTQVRTKEIGIRKTFGASVTSIIRILTAELFSWILIASGIAFLPAWYAMQNWLDNFPYRTTISWWVFGLSVVIIILIAIVTGGLKTYRAARKNPVEALRYE